MQRKFIVNLAFLVFVNFLIKPFWIFGIDRTVQNTVGTSEYGMYFAIFNFTFLFQMLLDFGINNFNNRAVSRDSTRLDAYFSKLIVFKILLSGAYIVIIFLIGWLIGFRMMQYKMLAFLALNQIFLSMILYFRSNIAALQLFRVDSIFSVMDRLFVIIFCSILLWGKVIEGPFQIEWFVYAQTAGLALTMVIAFSIVVGKVSFFKLEFDWEFIKSIARQSYPFAMLGLLMAIYNRIDAVMIERLLENGKTEAGIYAASYRLLGAAYMIPFLFTTILLPLFSKMIKQKESVQNVLELAVKIMMSGSIILSAACFFYRFEIMEALYPATTDYWAEIFGWIITSFNAIAIIFLYGSLLTANGSLKALNIIAFSGLIFNVLLNFVLIPRYAAMGATMATLFTQGAVAVAHIIVAHRILKLDNNIRLMLSLLILVLLSIIAGLLSTYYVDHWLAGFSMVILVGIAGAFLLRLLDLRSLYKLVITNDQEASP